MQAKSLSLTQLFAQLDERGYTVNRQLLSVAKLYPAKTFPWYLQLLMGIGIGIAFLLFLILLNELGFYDLGRLEQSIWAVGFIAVAILAQRFWVDLSEHPQRGLATLVTQTSFLLMLTGQGLLFYHFVKGLSVPPLWQVVIFLGVLAAITLYAYHVALAQVLSVALFLFMAQFIILPINFQQTDVLISSISSSMILLLTLIGLVYLTFSSRLSRYRYLQFGFIIAVFLRLTITPYTLSAEILSPWQNDSAAMVLFYGSYVVAIVLLGCMWYLAEKPYPWLAMGLLTVGLLALAYFLPATLFFALLLMVLGYAAHDKVILAIGLLLLPYYLFQYYYDLQTTLLNKSYLLMASGLILLLIAGFIGKMGWHRERQS